MGGGTTKIGDPSGKDESRKLLTHEKIQANIASIRKVFEHFLTFGDGPTDAIMVDNADWLDQLAYIDLLRTVGPAFHRQPDADLRFGQTAPRPRAAADLPRIQLHDPPGL
jgi:tyrosyl-tRNA synthetase